MRKYKAGFIGSGNMGFALASAIAKAEKSSEIILSCKEYEHAREKAALLGCASGTSVTVAKESKFIFLGIKPGMIKEIYEEIGNEIKNDVSDVILVSMLAGISLDTLHSYFGNDAKIIRIMPNTPVSVGSGLTLMCYGKNISEKDILEFKEMMRFSGVVDEIPESLIDSASAISGCGPAFLYMFAEALSDGAVSCGLPKDKALFYSLTMIKGASKLALVTQKHPSSLKDEVLSPGGSTIEGVAALEKGAFKGTVMNAVKKSFLKTKELGKN